MAQHFDRDKRSIAALNRQAKAGDAEAMAELGLRFFLGRGGAKRDTLKGLDWSERAIRVGDRQALRNLVTLMRVLPALDVYVCRQCLIRCAEDGVAYAQAFLGCSLADGSSGFPMNQKEALVWLRKAAAQNEPIASLTLGWCLMLGDGCEPDYDAACEAWRRVEGVDFEQSGRIDFALAFCALFGYGMPRDVTYAAKHLQRASETLGVASLWLSALVDCGLGVAEDRVRGAKLVAQAFNQGFPAHEEDFLAVDDVDEDAPSKQRAQALLAHIDRLREDPETPRRVHTQTRMIMENRDMVAEIH